MTYIGPRWLRLAFDREPSPSKWPYWLGLRIGHIRLEARLSHWLKRKEFELGIQITKYLTTIWLGKAQLDIRWEKVS